jgi:hypothetical protein
MSRNSVILVIIAVLLIMFAPFLFADGLDRFFSGLAVIYRRFTS